MSFSLSALVAPCLRVQRPPELWSAVLLPSRAELEPPGTSGGRLCFSCPHTQRCNCTYRLGGLVTTLCPL